MRNGYRELLNYVQEIEGKYGTVCLMNELENRKMLKLSKLCYNNEFANLNKYEETMIGKYLKGEIIIRQLAYYLNTTDGKALKMAQLYAKGRYNLTSHKNPWEVRRR